MSATPVSGADDRVTIGGVSYLIEGRIGVGETSDVFRGRRDGPFGELVVLKIARDAAKAEALPREQATLHHLGASSHPGAYHFLRQLPEIVASGKTEDGMPTTAFKRKNRFDWTLADAVREYPEGVDPRMAVWMWKRLLTLIGWVHLHNAAHGAVTPEHVLIHPANHAVTLVGWGASGPFSQARGAAALRPEEDIAMSARTIIRVLGGMTQDGKLPPAVPAEMADLLIGVGDMADRKDALALHEEFDKLTVRCFGKPKYRPFVLPRPSAGSTE